MTLPRKQLGRWGEDLAAAFLLRQNYRIIARNVQTRRGEIDIVAEDGQMIVFVEVRTRSSQRFGTPAESITWRKRQKLRELALQYLQAANESAKTFRFDVITVLIEGGEPRIKHFPHAF
ncbi:YraN family protein [Brevibacillus fulvus]|uniref:UPF0102 protein JOD01_001092 n=1 Tax=Brevibacillus fulvus TaxID=1125967 RepID=A0A938XWN4_9BACL|nr:YraN family protein [Brevibacillus fulvus]MBM7589494.1 putative endonuclease [Brevibacillus fulvus]